MYSQAVNVTNIAMDQKAECEQAGSCVQLYSTVDGWTYMYMSVL